MTAGQTWAQFTDGMDLPSRFRVIVLREGKRYSAVALEWYMVASANTPVEAVKRLEHLLFGQGMLLLEFRNSPHAGMKPAPEDYQRIATSGDFVCTHTGWKTVFPDSLPVVHRCVLDMNASRLRLVERA